MIDTQFPTKITPGERLLTAAEFNRLSDVPPEIEWFANLRNQPCRHTNRPSKWKSKGKRSDLNAYIEGRCCGLTLFSF